MSVVSPKKCHDRARSVRSLGEPPVWFLAAMFLAGLALVVLAACPHVGWLASLVCAFVGAGLAFAVAAYFVGVDVVRGVLREIMPLWRAIVALAKRL
jgi:hypothetical protein